MFEVGAVLQFFFRGEGEEVFADGELAVDLVLGEAEVGDVAGIWISDPLMILGFGVLQESDFVDSIIELFGELLFATWYVEL